MKTPRETLAELRATASFWRVIRTVDADGNLATPLSDSWNALCDLLEQLIPPEALHDKHWLCEMDSECGGCRSLDSQIRADERERIARLFEAEPERGHAVWAVKRIREI